MTEKLFEKIFNEFVFDDKKIKELSPLVLAYIGDAVYEVFIRTFIVSMGNLSVNALHKLSIQYVKAKAQNDILYKIMDKLSEEEKNIVRRGRNAKSGTIPKNASISEYKYATGFEALVGYLYLNKQYSRLLELLKMGLDIGDSSHENCPG